MKRSFVGERRSAPPRSGARRAARPRRSGRGGRRARRSSGERSGRAAQTSGGSIARSMRAISTSMRPIRSIAAACSWLPCGAALRRAARLAVEGDQRLAGLRQRLGRGSWCAIVDSAHGSQRYRVPAGRRGSTIATTWPRTTWSPTRDAQLGDPAGDRRGDGVLHLHRLEDDDRRRRHRPRRPARIDGADHGRASARRASTGPPGVGAAAAARGPVDVRRRRRCGTATLRPSTSTWTVSPTRTSIGRRVRGGRLDRSASRRRCETAIRGRALIGTRRPTVRPPSRRAWIRHGRSAAAAADQAASGIVGRAQPSRPAARSGRACRSARAPSRTAGSRTSQRRNRRFVVSPRTTVASSAAVRRSSAAVPVVAPGDDLGQHRVEPAADLVALGDAGVDADARSRRPAQALDAAGRRQEAGLGVLGVEADLDRVAGERDRRLVEPERLAGGDAQLVGHEVAAGDELGDRVLDLEPRVHLEEREGAALVEQELAGAGADVADRAGERERGRRPCAPGAPASTAGERLSSRTFWWRRWSEQSRSPRWTPWPWRVEEDLDLDVARALDEPLEDQPVVAERRLGLAPGGRELRRQALARRGRSACPCRHRRPPA